MHRASKGLYPHNALSGVYRAAETKHSERHMRTLSLSKDKLIQVDVGARKLVEADLPRTVDQSTISTKK